MSETPEFTTTPGAKDAAMARFYIRPVQNNFKSNLEGHPVFEDREFVEILIPGDRKTEVNRQVTEQDRLRWPVAYAAFKAGQEAPLEGTPLEEWAAITRSQAEELKFARIRTVEQLAALGDDHLNKSVSMGGFKLRAAAIRYLEQAKDAAPAAALAAENEDLKRTLSAMQAQLDALTQQAAQKAKPETEA